MSLGFAVVGIVFVIPHLGAFGVLWTLLAGVGALTSFYNAFSESGIADKVIDVSDEDVTALQPTDVEARLRRLDELNAKGLVTPAEYAERRRKILDTI